MSLHQLFILEIKNHFFLSYLTVTAK